MSTINQATTITGEYSGFADDELRAISADFMQTAGMTAYQEAGEYYSASNPSGFITGVDLTPYQTTADMTAYQHVGDYLTTADSANFYTIDNPSGFITGVDLSDYATTAELAGKQDAGDYLSATESANYYPMTGNPSGFLTEVPAGTLNESAFEYDANNKISGYNGSAFAGEGGGVVPEGVMAESGLEFNDDDEISGYNGSAFAAGGYTPSNVYILSAGSGVEITDDQVNKVTTIAITSQAGNPDVEAYVQNTSADIDATIINVSSNSGAWGGSALQISAGPGIKLNMVDDTLVASTDEIVLFSGTNAWGYGTITLSESLKNFERIKVLATRAFTGDGNADRYSGPWSEFECAGIANTTAAWGAVTPVIYEGPYWKFSTFTANSTFTELNWFEGGYIKVTNPSEYAAGTAWNDGKSCGIKAVIGINRIAGGN